MSKPGKYSQGFKREAVQMTLLYSVVRYFFRPFRYLEQSKLADASVDPTKV
jgi:hypothetical protein